MGPLRIVPDNTNIGFVRIRHWAFGLTALLTVAAVGATAFHGLELGVDFKGGISIEEKFKTMPSVDEVRSAVNGLHLGEASLQLLGGQNSVTIRLPLPKSQRSGRDQHRGREGEELSWRRNSPVRPSAPIRPSAARSPANSSRTASSPCSWRSSASRFSRGSGTEWQFGVSTAVAVIHDVVMAVGFFAITGMVFDLNIVAAVLTIIGYWINDKMVIDDRIARGSEKERSRTVKDLHAMALGRCSTR